MLAHTIDENYSQVYGLECLRNLRHVKHGAEPLAVSLDNDFGEKRKERKRKGGKRKEGKRNKRKVALVCLGGGQGKKER